MWCSPRTTGRPGDTSDIVEFLSLQRDLYAYLHDQTLRLLNQGYTGVEIAEMFQMPPALEQAWHTHGYYGSVSHNVKAVYQRYMGWFDGNPGRLWPHPPEALAPRYVEAMGGIDRVVELARTAFDSGDFRWAATLLDHAIFTDSDHAAARELYADTLEQLGYGAENATWRNFFLTGATELRDGNFGTATSTTSPTLLSQLTPGADLRQPRHPGQRTAQLEPRPRHRHHLRRSGYQLPAHPAQRRAGLPQDRRRPRDRRPLRCSWTASCGC